MIKIILGVDGLRSRFGVVAALVGVVFGLFGSVYATVASTNTVKTSGNIVVTAKKLLTIKGSLQAASSGVQLLCPDFTSATTGFIADRRGLLKTDNGGTTWSRVNTPKGSVQAVDFASAKVGFVLMALQLPTSSNAASQSGTFSLYRTIDGGSAWRAVWTAKVANSLQQGVVGLQALGEDEAVLRAGNRFLITKNGGRNWKSVSFTGQSLAAVEFTSSQNGIAVTVSPAQKNGRDRLSIWRTNDGGRHFTRQFQSKEASYGLDVQLGLGGNNGVVLAWDSWSWDTNEFWTNNGGSSWNAVSKPLIEGRVFPDQPMYLSAKQVLLPAGGGAGPLPSSLWVSTDGGKHFAQMNGQVLWRQLELSRAYGSTIYGLSQAGNGAQLLKTTNGGVTWQQVYPSLRPTENISFVSATQGFGIGSETDANAVLATKNGGSSWQVVGELPSGEQISALTFTTVQDGLAVADQPRTNELQVYQTTNGGHTWSLIKGGNLPKETASIIAGMGLIDPATIGVFSKTNWVIGANGYPQLYTLSTTNAGRSWGLIVQMADPPGAVEDFAFAGPTDGWMSMLETEKSGATTPVTTIYRLNSASHAWRSAWQLPAGIGIEGIARFGALDGWLVGVEPWPWSLHQRLVIYHTTNGGQSWEEYTSPVISNQLTISPPPGLTNVQPVEFVNANVGWLLTQNGLYRTTNGGQTWQNAVLAK